MADNLNKITMESDNDEILQTFAEWFKESNSYHDELLRDQKIAEQYYLGNQTDKDSIPSYQSNIVENRIFEGVETLVPIITANPHKFIVKPGSENESSVVVSNKLQKVLDDKYRTLGIQEKLEDIARHMIVLKFGVLEYGWDKQIDDIGVELIDPRLILIPKLRTDIHDLPYVIKIQEFTKEEFENEFPQIDSDELTFTSKVDTGELGQERKKTLKVYVVWTNDMVCWIGGGKVLDKKLNPYYDWEGEETMNGKKWFNHLDNPQKPFVFFTTFRMTGNPIGDKSLIDIVISIQDAINTQKRRIIDNIRMMANGQVLVDDDAITQEQEGQLTNQPGLIIRGPGVASENKVRRDPGVPLPSGHFENLTHSEAIFDNIVGVHAATRGFAQAETLGQDIISRQQDYTRVDMFTRVLNRGIDRLANGLVQLMKMFYTETHVFKILGEEGAVEFVNFNRQDIEDYIEIEVKSGSQLPMDEVSLRTEAVQLWQLGAIDPVTLFERLKFPNPELSARRLLLWKQGQLDMETMAKLAQVEAGGMIKDRQVETQNKQRGMESVLNVLQRSQQGLGGAVPKQKGTPNLAGQKKVGKPK